MRLSFFIVLFMANVALLAQENDFVDYEVFEPGVISLPGVIESSPSVTADGNTLVFTRYQSYRNQVPYIANRTDEGWEVERLPFIDTLYNLAISPNGDRILFRVRGQSTSASYRVDRLMDGSWGEPVRLPGPYYSGAGYFRFAPDRTVYMYINGSHGGPRGIYYVEENWDGSYGKPRWLSDGISPHPATVYSPIVNSDETKIIVNRGYLRTEEEKAKLGPSGLHIHTWKDKRWDYGPAIKGLPQTFYAEILPDGRFIFVQDGDLQVVSLETLGLEWK